MKVKSNEKDLKKKIAEATANSDYNKGLYEQLKNGTKSDISSNIIELSTELHKARLDSYRHKTDNQEFSSKNQHYKRLLE